MIKIIIISSISLIFFYISNIFGRKFNFLDHPNKRKIHAHPIPYTGGLGLILSFFFLIWILYFDLVLSNIIFTSFFIFIVGFLDDKFKMNPSSRILFQFLIIFFFINTYKFEIKYIFDLDELFKLDLGGLSLIFTILCVSLIINAFNYSDGLDGLITTQTIFILFSLVFFQLYYYHYLNYHLLYMVIPLFIFLFFNYKLIFFPKIFLGNGGSTMLGFIMSFILIYYGYYADLNIDPELLIWSLSFIVFEFISTNLSRFRRNQSLFKPGRDHIHFILLNKFKSAFKVNCIIFLINFLFLIVGFFSFLLGDIFSLASFIIFFSFYYISREKLLKIYKEN